MIFKRKIAKTKIKQVTTDREYALLGMAYKVCCPMCDEKTCVKWSERCDARKWFEKNRRTGGEQ